MTDELAVAIQHQIESLNARVAEQRAALEREEDRECAAILRQTISQTEKLAAKIDSIRTAILTAEFEAQNAAEKFAGWRRLVVQIRAMEAERDELARQIPPLREQADFTRDAAMRSRSNLIEHQSIKFGATALEREKAEHGRERGRLEREVEAKRLALQQAESTLGDVQGRALDLQRRIGELQWRASLIGPRELYAPKPDSDAVMTIA